MNYHFEQSHVIKNVCIDSSYHNCLSVRIIFSVKVERAVVNQLAIAFERQVIKQGEHVRLIVDYPKDGKPAVKIAIMNCS